MTIALTIVLAVLIVEAGSATYAILRRSSLPLPLAVVRIGAFALFLALLLLGTLEWGARYLPLAGVLLIRAGIGAVQLARRQGSVREFRTRRTVRSALLMTLALWAATLPVILFPQHRLPGPTGEHQIATVSYTWSDDHRLETHTQAGEQRTINVQFWFPVGADGTYPLVVFSHGGFGVRTSNASLFGELASHGYVVASIDHTYHSLYTADEDGRRTWIDLGYLKELSEENALLDREQSYRYYTKWMAVRTGDIDLVIDRIKTEAARDGAGSPYGMVDITKIGVIGHSLGGSAALGIGRSRDDVAAVIALESPLLLDIEGVGDGGFRMTPEAYPVPVLNVYSDVGWGILADRPQYAANHALLTDTAAVAWNVHVEGVGHLGLTDLALTSPVLTRLLDGDRSTGDSAACLEAINGLCLEFFDRYLKKVGTAAPDPVPTGLSCR